MDEKDRCETCQFLPCRCEELASDRPMNVGQSSAGWPRKSLTYGCLRHQIPGMIEQYAQRGEQVDFTSDGRMVITDPGQQRRIMKLHGDVDLSREITAPKRKTMKERSIRPRPNRKFSETR